ncbi:hypothetical protein NMG29_28455 [Streptomyces cocklensis]|nr:hypothetical protein [Actinacidiphila cocklensis]
MAVGAAALVEEGLVGSAHLFGEVRSGAAGSTEAWNSRVAISAVSTSCPWRR